MEDVEAYFVEINHRLCKLGSTSTSDINEIVPLSILKEDSDFYQYLFESNNTLGMRQVVNLAKIAAFCKDTTLREDRQSELKKQSLEFWNIPDKARFSSSSSFIFFFVNITLIGSLVNFIF